MAVHTSYSIHHTLEDDLTLQYSGAEMRVVRVKQGIITAVSDKLKLILYVPPAQVLLNSTLS